MSQKSSAAVVIGALRVNCPGKSVSMSTYCLDMTIAVDWDVKSLIISDFITHRY